MGITILELVLKKLRTAAFTVDVAYPGQKYPEITEIVAAIHIRKADRAGQEVTVQVDIIGPAALGGTACEMEALRAVEILRLSGAACVQEGCSYDAVAQAYRVPILATFMGIAEVDNYVVGPGFQVYIDDVELPYVVGFTSETERDCKVNYSIGEEMPVDSSTGKVKFNFRLEELIPAGNVLTAESAEFFTLRFQTYSTQEIFYGCRWTSVKREFNKEGMRRIREGFARLWEDVTRD